MKFTVDRIEGEFAVLEKDIGRYVQIPVELIPDACEGDIIDISVCKDDAGLRKKRIKDLHDKLFN